MLEPQRLPESQLEELARQVRILSARVDEISRLLLGGSPEDAESHLPGVDRTQPGLVDGRLQSAASTALPAVATVCFLLVIALVLRTVADNGTVERSGGLAMGIAYASLLMAYGYYRFGRGRRLGSVFAACGVVLLLSIAFEGHRVFNVLSAGQAYALLAITLAAAVTLPQRWRLSVSACAGVLGAAVIGIAVDFPAPFFPHLAALVLLANVAAYALGVQARYRWLRWAVLAATVFFWFLWALRMRLPLENDGIPADAGMKWLVPWLVTYGVFYTAVSLWALFSRELTYGRFETILPSVNALGGSAVAAAALSTGPSPDGRIATAGVLSAAAFLVLAARLDGRSPKRVRAAVSFAVPGVILLAVWLPACLGSLSAALGLWAVAALGLAWTSWRWRDRDIRMLSYALQTYGCALAVGMSLFSKDGAAPLTAATLAGLLAILSAAHFAWSRRHRPRHGRGCIQTLDPHDRASLMPFLCTVVYAFAGARLILHLACVAAGMESNGGFQSGQSILINVGALLLALLALGLVSGEILAVAALVAVVGAFKVFAYDLTHIQGLSLVLSVFSFGMTAALGSIIWGRWQRRESAQP